jgi:hypothetical protein
VVGGEWTASVALPPAPASLTVTVWAPLLVAVQIAAWQEPSGVIAKVA